MTMNEADELLKRNNIDRYIYNIGPPKLAECFVLEKRGLQWITYNWERGKEWFIKTYPDEDAAARSFVNEVVEIASISAGKRIVLE